MSQHSGARPTLSGGDLLVSRMESGEGVAEDALQMGAVLSPGCATSASGPGD